jgi:hypothetical protein
MISVDPCIDLGMEFTQMIKEALNEVGVGPEVEGATITIEKDMAPDELGVVRLEVKFPLPR